MSGSREALLIATGSYEDAELRRLRSPAQDATALASVLSNPAIGGFTVHTLVNEQHHVVSRSAEQFFDNRGLGDLLLLHLSCHGVKDDRGRLYFTAADTEKRLLRSTAVAASYLNRRKCVLARMGPII